MKLLPILTLSFCLAALLGCQSTPTASTDVYETNPTGERGDTEEARTLNAVALEFLDQGELDKAEETLKQALTADVMFGPAHNNLGKVYYEQGRYYLAAWEFQYAVKLMPNHPEPRNNLGLVFEAVDRLDKAVAYYREALDLEPDNVEILGNLARARVTRGDRDTELRGLLADLIFKDTRPEWTGWARDKMAILGGPPSAPEAIVP
ncbi:MAG: tetratricopeptide repeat protein [Phycisphaeraceae bacterium]|nr:tetratricopeptide repeat protein [Phycisphaeraceae bacterium]